MCTSRSFRPLLARTWLCITAGVALAVVNPALAAGQSKLVASDGAAGDWFGSSIAVAGDTVVVGAPRHDHAASDAGAAYVFERIGPAWVEAAELTASDGAAGDQFGFTVSVSGDVVVVGAVGDDDNGVTSGSAYVFEKVSGVWTQVAKLLASDGAIGDQFAYSVAVSAGRIVAGAMTDDDMGSAYVFEKVSGVWSEVAKLTAVDAAVGDEFGRSVSVSGDTIVVGAGDDDDNGDNSGSVYVFEKVSGVWTETAKLTASDGAPGDQLGYSVAVSGDTVVGGAFDDDDSGTGSGSAYVFTRNAGVWSQAAKLLAPDGAASDQFGRSVSISGRGVVVGARFDDDMGSASGSVYLYESDGGAWTSTGKLVAPDGAAGDQLGFAVGLADGTVVAGAFADDDGGSATGSGWVFDLARSPEELAADLVAAVEDLVEQEVLNGGQGNALIAKLEAALRKLTDGKVGPAINEINAFVNQVASLVGEGILTPAQAAALTDGANDLIDAILAL